MTGPYCNKKKRKLTHFAHT